MRYRCVAITCFVTVSCVWSCAARSADVVYPRGILVLQSYNRIRPYVVTPEGIDTVLHDSILKWKKRGDAPAYDAKKHIVYLGIGSMDFVLEVPSVTTQYVVRYRLDAINSSPEVITEGRVPRLSPDCRKLAFIRDGHDLWLRDVVTGIETRSPAKVHIQLSYLVWFGDEEIVYYDPDENLCRLSIPKNVISNTGHRFVQPLSASPNLKQIVCNSNHHSLVLFFPQTNEIRDLIPTTCPTHIIWLPDSSGFFFSTYEHPQRNIYDLPSLHFYSSAGRTVDTKIETQCDGGFFVPD